MFSLANKVAVITGAASGIGLATARRFSEAGAKVVLADVADASEAAAELGGRWVSTDVGDEKQVQALMRAAADVAGHIDICVNNAGIGTEAPLHHTSGVDLTRNWSTNTVGVFFGMKHALPFMPSGSAIVNTASIAGVLGYPTYAAYAASKWAVVGLTKVAALEYGPRGIRVNCVCPSSVNTPMLRNMASRDSETAALLAAAPLDDLIEPEHIAAAMQFLVADDCPLISGQALIIDGGATAGISTRLIELAMRGLADAV
jgi:NAD(P)-dependent dehydrogenase (short-subunit alcohol dehydrogenase family)